MSNKVLSVVYHVLPAREITSRPPETKVACAFRGAVRADEWLYDPSDDPSFYSARRFAADGGALSWGICRRNVRCPLKRGDLVSFVGMEDRDGLYVYYFCGWATVARKVTQEAIWLDDELAVYRHYLNLLCKPVPEGFAHYEPHASDLHDDWLWRMTCTPNKRWKVDDFAGYRDPEGIMTFHPGVDRAANGAAITLAANYVIFDPDGRAGRHPRRRPA